MRDSEMMIGLMVKGSDTLRGMIYDYESDMWHWVGAGFLGWHISDGVVCTLTFGYIIGIPLSLRMRLLAAYKKINLIKYCLMEFNN
jgi:hypothetical protein